MRRRYNRTLDSIPAWKHLVFWVIFFTLLSNFISQVIL